MRRASASKALRRVPLPRRDRDWTARSARLHEEFARPARAMLRRAFRGAFDDDELDDIYASAWVGTLRALESRHDRLSDDEIRSYVFTAVANQAGKELRRRRRKPVAPLELAATIADSASRSPEESAATAEESRVTRDLLASLPTRRRAVILLRYGWGLEPKQICGLIKGLSPRAYRKEITRGVDELTEKIRRYEAGEWCDDREPVLKAYAAGLASVDQERQAQAHLAHCRACSDFIARLTGHLHDLGGALAVPATVDGIDGHLSVGDRLVALGDRARETATGVFGGGDRGAVQEAATVPATSGGTKGAGAAGAGVLAKLAGLGTAGKLALACAGGTAALTACVAAGIGPVDLQRHKHEPGVETTASGPKPDGADTVQPSPPLDPSTASDAPGSAGSGQASPPTANGGNGADSPGTGPEPAPAPAPTPTPAPAPAAPTAPPAEQEFGVAGTAAPVESTASSGDASSSSSGTSAATVRQEFGP